MCYKDKLNLLKKSIKREDILVLLLYSLLAILSFRIIIFSNKMPGHSGDWAIPATNLLLKHYFYINNYVWADQFLGYFRSWYLYNFFYQFIGTFPAIFGFSGIIVAKMWVVTTAVASSFFFYIFLKNLMKLLFDCSSISNVKLIYIYSSLIGGWFYGLGFIRFGLTLSGQFFAVQAGYVFVPLMLLSFLKCLVDEELKYVILFSLFSFFVFIGWIQLYLAIIIIFLIFISINMVLDVKSFNIEYLKKSFKFVFLYTTIITFLSSYFVIPTMLNLDKILYKGQAESPIKNLLVFYKTHAFLLPYSITGAEYTRIASLPRVSKCIFPVWYIILVTFVSVLVYGAPLLLRKKGDKLYYTMVISCTLTSLLFLFLAAGPYYSPLPQFHLWLYTSNIKVLELSFIMYKYLDDWLISLVIPYSILLSIGLYCLLGRMCSVANKKVLTLSLLIITAVFIFLDYPLLLGEYTKESPNLLKDPRALDLYAPNPEIINFYEKIKNDREDYRIIFIPLERYAIFLPTEFQHGNRIGEDPLRLFSLKQNIDISRKYSPEIDKLSKNICIKLYSGQPELIELLKLLSVRYIILRKDVKPLCHFYDYDKIYNSLMKHGDITLVSVGNWVTIFRLNNSTAMIRVLQRTFYTTDIWKVLNSEYGLKLALANAILQINRIENGVSNENNCQICLFEAESDLYRKNAEISKDFNASNGEVLKFVKDGEAWQNLEIIKEGNYRLALRGMGHFKVSIANKTFELRSNSLDFVYTPLFNIPKGKYKLEILASKSSYLDVLWLYSTDTNQTIQQLFEVKERAAKVINYTKINPTLWKVSVNATKPFMLSFAESYDPLWEARVYKNGKLVEKVKPVPLYGVINGFWISQTGDLQIVLRYKPQDWFELGLAISAMTFTLCIFYLIWDWRRSRGDRWALGLEKVFRRTLTSARK